MIDAGDRIVVDHPDYQGRHGVVIDLSATRGQGVVVQLDGDTHWLVIPPEHLHPA